jgi:hypothetical protein
MWLAGTQDGRNVELLDPAPAGIESELSEFSDLLCSAAVNRQAKEQLILVRQARCRQQVLEFLFRQHQCRLWFRYRSVNKGGDAPVVSRNSLRSF